MSLGADHTVAAEVESAGLLANDARQALLDAGFSEEIDRLAADFIGEDRGPATERFIDWTGGCAAPPPAVRLEQTLADPRRPLRRLVIPNRRPSGRARRLAARKFLIAASSGASS
jgi:hypothetical protein